MMPIKHKRIETILLYFVIKKNLEISFQNGPEHETTSLMIPSLFLRVSLSLSLSLQNLFNISQC